MQVTHTWWDRASRKTRLILGLSCDAPELREARQRLDAALDELNRAVEEGTERLRGVAATKTNNGAASPCLPRKSG